jgi:protein gp37
VSTAIEWTDETWNPVTGCDRVSPGCDHCYAETIAKRFGGPDGFQLQLHPERLEKPLHWRKPRRVFVNSMSDLFHPDIPLDLLAQVWDVMVRTPQHTYQVLTKRPQRMARALGPNGIGFYAVEAPVPFPQPNIWLGTSVENQRYADLRIPHLLATPAAVRFLSIEPLLGPVDLTTHFWLRENRPCPCGVDHPRIDWVIVGGESGPGSRPVESAWVRTIRDQCVEASVPFFFKQWGGTRKKQTGRELDGRTWDEFPAQSVEQVSACDPASERGADA